MGEGVFLPQHLHFLAQSQGHHASHSSVFECELEPSDPPGDSGVSGHGLDHVLCSLESHCCAAAGFPGLKTAFWNFPVSGVSQSDKLPPLTHILFVCFPKGA